MFLKNKNIIFEIRRSKVTDYAALTVLLYDISAMSEKFLFSLLLLKACSTSGLSHKF